MPVTATRELVAAHPQLAQFAAALEHMRTNADPTAWWVCTPEQELTCDGGALAAALIARRLHVPVQLCVGLYWHHDVALRLELMGEEPAAGDPDEWAKTVAWAQDCAMDEHHHWVVLWPNDEEPVLVDPNGPVRREPYLQPQTSTQERYDDPAKDWTQLAAKSYPGMLEVVEQATSTPSAP